MTTGHSMEIVMQMKCSKKRLISGATIPHVYRREMAQNPGDATKFAATVRVLRILLCQLIKGNVSTLRDVYYKDVTLFKGKQVNLNIILDSIADSLGFLLQSDLNVFPTPKGIIWSTEIAEITIGDKTLLLKPTDEPMLISHAQEMEKLTIDRKLDLIIVFEKEAILRSFVSYLRLVKENRPFLLLTGKGFPDRATVSFLQGLNMSSPYTPVSFFVDSDVYGLQIFRSYIQNSPSLSRISKLGGAFIVEERTEWLTTDRRDWARGVRFAQRNMELLLVEHQQEKNAIQLVQRELQRVMMLFKKAEMNVIKDDLRSALSVNHYLWSKIPKDIRDKT